MVSNAFDVILNEHMEKQKVIIKTPSDTAVTIPVEEYVRLRVAEATLELQNALGYEKYQLRYWVERCQRLEAEKRGAAL